jgi:acyl phosphate:glycerol-3-phosphate acyltransferase
MISSMGQPATRAVGAAFLGYLCGTAPSADVAARIASGGTVQLRTSGSGNPGATNAIAVLGRRWGYAVLVADIAKSAAACVAGGRLAGARGAHLGGTAAVVGHCFPIWNGFRGGKGVACSVGQCAMTFPVYVPLDLALVVVTAKGLRRDRAFTATAVGSAAWIAGAVVWWRKGWCNLWGPRPTAALPIAAAASSAVILFRFASARREA